mmetsp:Transcript_3974/g.11552  ORF Transcript_3974/g.11552 Transcript_3974/m.11552 type:complete len:368 (-) Transcript_3974:190-1293(-)
MRADINVSVTPPSHDAARVPRVEVKNLNSLAQIRLAAEHEAQRQAELWKAGEAVQQETRTYDPARQATVRLRVKGGGVDYRYCPEPDLEPLVIGDEVLEAARVALAGAEPLFRTRQRWQEEHGFRGGGDGGTAAAEGAEQVEEEGAKTALPAESVHATLFFDSRASLPALFDAILAKAAEEDWDFVEAPMRARVVMVWMEHSVIPTFRAALDGDLDGAAEVPATTSEVSGVDGMAALFRNFKSGDLSTDGMRDVLGVYARALLAAAPPGGAADRIDWTRATVPCLEGLMDELGLRKITDAAELRRLVVAALDDEQNAKQRKAVLGGKDQLRKFFFGKAMVASGKRADIGVLQDVLDQEIDARRADKD